MAERTNKAARRVHIKAARRTLEVSAKELHALRSWPAQDGSRHGWLSAGATTANLLWRAGELAPCTDAHEAVRDAILARGGEVLDLRDRSNQRLTVDQAAVILRYRLDNGQWRVHYRHGEGSTNAFLDDPKEVSHA